MRRNQFVAFVFTSLCFWAAATYYLFLHRPISRPDEQKGVRVEDHLDVLEERLKQQFADNERLLADIKDLVKDSDVQKANEGVLPLPDQDNNEIPLEQGGQRLHHEEHAEHHPGAIQLPPDPETELLQQSLDDLQIQEDPVQQQSEAQVPPVVDEPKEKKKETNKEDHKEGNMEHLLPQAPPPPPPPQKISSSTEDKKVTKLRSLAAGIPGVRDPAVAVLVLACNRVTVRKCLDQLLAYRPSAESFPIIVSQDCRHQPTSDAIASYRDQVTHIQQPDQSEIEVPPKEKKFRGYFNIARHYGWALNETFLHFNFKTVIIVEDDLDIAPDFFEYFTATLPILRQDSTLWCVSAWNDNGKASLVDEKTPELLYRTDFFPGLGWMLTQDTWIELAQKWPASYWDDWVRQPEQRRDRACIRPELSRTRTFGKVGVSNGHFFDKHLKFIKLNEKSVPFTRLDLSYLLKDNYDVEFVRKVYNSPVVTYQELMTGNIVASGPVRIPYHTKDTFKRTAKMLGLMDDFRSGVPRTGYRGVVSFMYKARRVYLAPSANWKNYDPSWS